MTVLHVPCCLLSVPCDVCQAGYGESCRTSGHGEGRPSAAHVCTCHLHDARCCTAHYRKEAS